MKTCKESEGNDNGEHGQCMIDMLHASSGLCTTQTLVSRQPARTRLSLFALALQSSYSYHHW